MSSKSFKELMQLRHSARAFLSKPIPEETLKEIISTALLTPSWANSQPWHIYVASGKTLEEIRKGYITNNKEGKKGYSDLLYGNRTAFSEKCQKNMGNIKEKLSKILKSENQNELWEANHILFNAPTMVYITVPKKRVDFCIFDAGAIEMSIMLSAMDQGVDSVAAYHSIKYPDILRKYMNIPDDEDIVMDIALGYEDKNNILSQIKTERMSLDEACIFYN